MFLKEKPKESVVLHALSIVGIIGIIPIGNTMITFISIQKMQSIVLVLVAMLKLVTRVPEDTKVEIIILQFIIALPICGEWSKWMKTCARLVILPLGTSVIAIVDNKENF
jgi:hypothetical protein